MSSEFRPMPLGENADLDRGGRPMEGTLPGKRCCPVGRAPEQRGAGLDLERIPGCQTASANTDVSRRRRSAAAAAAVSG
jgi:hypothetical protein